ncbi:hypothetical protein B0H16DRAFT_1485419 [Mycena metata]|uniref:Uncharacterized protein n=1 Tax=Mycena metata TaxID=1033252 RepID=A0AAD7DMR0_9AGAR|nr:hypothetical protein B0H16DRAFT_1485419 [Mycena metata]
MTSIPTNSHFHPISSPPPPVVLLLADVRPFTTTSAPPDDARKTARAFPSRFSSPLTSDSGSDDPPTPTATPAPVASSSSSSTTSNGKIIPRPTGAQLRVRSCDIIPKNLRDDLRKRVKTLASQRLDLASPYGKQDKEALRLVESDISAEFPWLLNYQDQWPLQVFLTAVLKYKKSRADVTKMKKIAEALA